MATLNEKFRAHIVSPPLPLPQKLTFKHTEWEEQTRSAASETKVVFAVIVLSDPWDFGETLHRCAPDWWVYFTPGNTVQATDWSAASVPTLLSEEVTSIHPIKLLAQARQLWKIGTIPALLSQIGPLLNWEREDLFWRCKCQGKKFLPSASVISR